jgi:surfactin synthase thioesterase subunit
MSICNIQKLNNPAQVKLSLVCFHWAGGNGMAYKPMARVLEASGFAVYAISLPGRNGRGTSAMFRRMADIINTLHTEFSAYHKANSLGDHPLIFFGHSFGGLVCFELYKSLIRKDDSHIVVDKIIVSAVRCPANLTEANKDASRVYHHKQTSKELIEYMHGIGGKYIESYMPCVQLVRHCVSHTSPSCLHGQAFLLAWTRRSSI